MDYVEIARFNSRLEGEMVGHALERYGVPHVIDADDGGGALGVLLSQAVVLKVPPDRVYEADQIVDSIIHHLRSEESGLQATR